MLAVPISVQFSPLIRCTVCPGGPTEPLCTCSGLSPPQIPPLLPGLSLHAGHWLRWLSTWEALGLAAVRGWL